MANVENIPPQPQLSSTDTDNVKTKSKPRLNSSSDRKKLQTLQPSSKNQMLLVGADGKLRMSGSKSKEAIKIYEDPQCSSTPEKKTSAAKDDVSQDREVQATVDTREGESQVEEEDTAQARAEEFMYKEDYPPEYWKELAEKTREALEKSLIENEELHTSLTLVEEEKEALKEENEGLKEMAKQAEELAKIVKGLTADESEEEDSSEESEEENEDETV